MGKAKRIILMLLIAVIACSCNRQTGLTIEPIDRELNKRLITPGALNKDLFSTKELFQYYHLDNYSGLPPNALLRKLDRFISYNYNFGKMKGVSEIDFLFYRKRALTNLSKHIYEAARDNENGSISGYEDDLVARITYSKFNGNKAIRAALIYSESAIMLNRTDSLGYR